MVAEDTITRTQFGGAKIVRKIPEENGVSGVLVPALVIVLVILAGVGTGWLLAQKFGGSGGGGVIGAKVLGGVSGGSVDQCKENSIFKDSAEGELVEGGIDGEGMYHLVREGGPSQYVYLTSTWVDLSGFVGKKVKVTGETMRARKAGWLMDVGCVKPL